jgi:DNA-binding NarL/FixJ family response regulator
MARIMIVDDNFQVRRGLRMLLEQDEDWKICAEAVNGEDALHKVQAITPDLIVLDFQMPIMNGLEAAREITKSLPGTPILLCTMHLSLGLIGEARRAGISGTVSKCNAMEIINGVKALLRHEQFFCEPT